MSPRRFQRLLSAALLIATACVAAGNTFHVTVTTDSGAGSLRDAISQANADNAPPRVINFDVAGTITLSSALPAVTKFMTLDGTTAPGFTGTPVVVVDGNSGDFDGLIVNAFFTGISANKTFIKGLCIVNCGTNGGPARNGMTLVDGDSVNVTGCYIGLNAAGTAAARNTGAGIRCELAVATIGGTTAADRCVISGNLGAGIDGQTDGSNQGSPITVTGCYIGVSADGSTALANGGDGIRAVTSVSSAALTIGSTTAGGRNVISANGGAGIRTQRPATIKANWIGLAADGSTALGNTSHGILIEASASVVGFGTGAGNAVSANGGVGIRVSSPSSSRSTIRDNFIGTDGSGMLARGNGGHGVEILGGGSTGGAALGNNVISANTGSGVRVASGDGNITTCKIGVSVDGATKLANGGDGILIDNVPNLSLSSNTIGGNTGAGVHVTGASATKLSITGNFIGTPSATVGNTGNGITIDGGAQDAIIGSTSSVDSNVNEIANNGGVGISFPVRTRILFNKIYANTGLPLDRGGDGADSPAPALRESALAPRSGPDGKINTATITQAKINTQFPDRVDINYAFHQTSLASTPLRIFFYGNLNGIAGMRFPLGFADVTPNVSGDITGTIQFVLSDLNTSHITDAVVTDVSSNPTISCSSEVASGVAIGGGGPPPPPSITNDTFGAHLFSTTTGDPVSTFTGEAFGLEGVDLNLRGPFPLFFARYYASKLSSDGNITGALGRNRLHNFEAALTVSGSNATVVLSDGRAVQFTKVKTAWLLAGKVDIPFQLVQSGTDFIFADPRTQWMWTFAADGKLTKLEDGRGNAHTLTYDGNGRLVTVTDDLQRTLTFGYDGNNHLTTLTDGARTVSFGYTAEDLTTVTDALTNTTTYHYDAGHLLATDLPRGNTPLTQTYDANSRVATQTEHPSAGETQTTSLAYDAGAHATTISDPTNATRVHTSTATGELSTFIDEQGNVVTTGSDATGRRSTVTDRLGRKTTIVYHAASGKPASITTGDGAATSFTYKARVVRGITFYDLVKTTFADGTTAAFAYDASGHVLSTTDQLGKKTSFTYDPHGQLLTATNATGGTMTLTYDAKEDLSSRIDNDAGIGATTYTYDAFSRLTRITHPDATHLDATYDAADRITSVTDERGGTAGFGYDANGNVTTITDRANNATQFTYDALDRITQVTNRLGKIRTLGFDPRDLLASETDELGNTIATAHDARQRVASVTEPGNVATTFGYNDEAELTTVTDPIGGATHFARNPLGGVIAATDPLGHTTVFERDPLQRIVKAIEPTGRASRLFYDKRGLLIGAARDGAGAATYTRDAAGRVVKISDASHGSWKFSYSPAGRLKTTSDPLGNTSSYAYDARGQLAMITLPDAVTCAVEHDAAGNTTRLNFSGGPDLHYAYDALGRLSSANDAAVRNVQFTYDAEGRTTHVADGPLSSTATYDDAGRLATLSYTDGVVSVSVTYTYDARDRLTRVADASGGQVDFTYDAANRLLSLTRNNSTSTTFTHDAAGRVTRIQHSNTGGTFGDLNYTLNADGDAAQVDLTAPVLPAVTSSAQQFSFNAASQVTTTGYSYDARGQLTAALGHTFTWDGASRLKTIDSVVLTYNALGELATRVDGAESSSFLHLHELAFAPIGLTSSPSTDARTGYVWTPDGRLLYALDIGNAGASVTPRYYHFDRLGSTLAITDGTGAVASKYAYSPDGERLVGSSAADSFTFVGEHGIRTEGEFYDMRARYYDPFTARFLSRDPAGPNLADVRSLDPYLYALGNPTRYIDTTGAAPEGTGGDAAFALFFSKFLLQGPLPGEEIYDESADANNYEYKPFYGRVRIPDIQTRVEQPTLPAREVFNSEPGAAKTAASFVSDAIATTTVGTPSTIDTRELASRTQFMVGLLATGSDDFARAGALFLEEPLRDLLHREVDAIIAEKDKYGPAPTIRPVELFAPAAQPQIAVSKAVSRGKKQKGIGPLNAFKEFKKAAEKAAQKAAQKDKLKKALGEYGIQKN